MFATVTKGFKYAKDKVQEKISLWQAEAFLNLAGISAEDVDVEGNIILFQTLNDKTALFIIDSTGYRLESTVAFDVEANTLKALSDMAELAFKYKCCLSGLRPSGPDRVKVILSYHLGSKLDKDKVEDGVELLGLCIEDVVNSVTIKIENMSKATIDISMFADLDANIFNPKLIGEKKEFLYHNWDNYAKAVLNNSPVADTTLEEIMACKEFEEINRLPLAEVGDVARRELGSHQVKMNHIDDLSIH